jgi:hypothetical protein
MSLFVLSADIQIGRLACRAAASLTVESGWKRLGDSAKVVLPRTIATARGTDIRHLAKVGDPATVRLGYDGQNRIEFEGVVARITPGVPVAVELEDGFHGMRRLEVNQTFRSATLEEVLAAIAPGIPVDCPGIALGAFRIAKASPAKVLAELASQYGIYSYFREGILKSGFAYDHAVDGTVDLDFRTNVASAQGLAFRTQDDGDAFRVNATSMMPDGRAIKHSFGPDGGAERSLHFYNLELPDLKVAAEAEAGRLNAGGYTGTITLFGAPSVVHGQVVRIKDADYPEREGGYYVDSTALEFGSGGFRRTLTLGRRAL